MPEACDRQDAALLYWSGELEARERAEFETHLSGCSACRGWLAELVQASALARRALLSAPAPRLPGRPAWGWRQRAQAAAAGCGLAFACAAFLLALARTPRAPLPSSGALDAKLGSLGERLDRLDAQLTRDEWDLEYEQGWHDLNRRRETLESQLATEGA